MRRIVCPASNIFLLVFGFFLTFILATPVKAADVTVCDSGCDYTTISDAITGGGFSSGDTISVESPYSSTTESFNLFPPVDVNLTCLDTGVTIGLDSGGPAYILPQGGNTISNCHFNNVVMQMDFTSTTVSGSDFMGTSIITGSNTTNLTIQNNVGIYKIGFNGTQDSLVTGNQFLTIGPENGGLFFSNVARMQITSNTIIDTVTSTNMNYSLMRIGSNSSDVYFATNTMSTPYATFYGSGSSRIEISQSTSIVLRDNLFSFSGSGGGVQVLNFNGSAGDIAIDAEHNTIKLNDPCQGCSGILMSSWNVSDVSVTSAYNLIAATTPSSTANMQGHSSYGAGPSSSLHLFTDHEGFANLNVVGTTDFPTASNSIILSHNPFRTDDASSSNDSELVPYSAFLDVNGSDDIGAVAGIRGNTFHVDAAGTIDYVSVDATTTGAIDESLRNGDTVYFANGTYGPLQTIQKASWTTPLTGNIALVGSGPGTVFHATSTGSGLLLKGVSTSTFSDMTFSDATGPTINTSYAMTHTLLHYNGIDYDQTSFIFAPDIMLVVYDSLCTSNITLTDGLDVTAAVGSASNSWNAALLDLAGNKITVWIPNNVANSTSSLETFISATCGSPATVDQYVQGVFTPNGDGTLSYNAAAVAAVGASIKAGETMPPSIARTQTYGSNAGVLLHDSNNNAFTNIRSTNNPFGVIFRGSSNGNTFTDSVLSLNAGYDVLGQSSGDNLFVDTSFVRTSSSFPGNGSLTAKYSVRGHVQDNNGQGLNGVSVTFQSGNGATTTLVTGSTGDTLLTSPLPAFTLSSSTNSATGGGFNPYSVTVAGFGTLLSTSTQMTVMSIGQSVTLTMLTAAQITSGGGGGGGGGGGIPLPIPTSGYAEETDNASRITFLNGLGYAVHDLVKLKDDGNQKTQEDTTVYYLGADGRRHAFPHFSVYFTWYCDFSKVKIIPASDLASIPLGKNVTYRPGIRLVKFISVPTVYVVMTGGILRAIPDEKTARIIAGDAWGKTVHDINDAFYLDYQIGAPLASTNDLDESPTYPSGSMNISGYIDPGMVSGRILCTARTTFRFTADLAPGSTDTNAVKRLQTLLGIAPTGIYGTVTVNAVRAFQAEHGILPTTGIAGPLTREKLNAELAGQ